MPGKAAHRQNKPSGHLAQHANDKNDVSVSALFEGDPSKFVARIAANRGPYFQLVFHDGSEANDSILLGSPCGAFVAGGKRKCKVRVRLAKDDIVVVEGCERFKDAKIRKKQLVVEITGKLSRKEAQQLYRAGRIHSTVYSKPVNGVEGEDDLFDYSEEDDEEMESEEEDDHATRTKRGMCATRMKAGGKKATANIKSRQDAAEGGGGGREKKNDVLADALAATEYAAGVAGAAAVDEGEDDEHAALAEMLGVAKPVKEPAGQPPAAAAAQQRPQAPQPPQEENWGDALLAASGAGDDPWAAAEIALRERRPVPDNWEEEADLDIDAI
jgi:hypothetical protein